MLVTVRMDVVTEVEIEMETDGHADEVVVSVTVEEVDVEDGVPLVVVSPVVVVGQMESVTVAGVGQVDGPPDVTVTVIVPGGGHVLPLVGTEPDDVDVG